MTDAPGGGSTAERPHREHPEHELMPRWVPVAIGVVLVTLAVLAVVTGMRYRDPTLVSMIHPRSRQPRPAAPAPPGEPEAGASLVFNGDSGSNVPTANAPVSNGSRAEVTGDAKGINA